MPPQERAPRASFLTDPTTSRDIFGVCRGRCTSCTSCGRYLKSTADYTVPAGAQNRRHPDNDVGITLCSRCGCPPEAHETVPHEQEREAGNDAFALGRWDTALAHYSRAIELLSPAADAALFSNRAAAYLAKGWPQQALHDAEHALALRPDWAKAWGRKGAALLQLGRADEAAAAYRTGLQLDGTSPALQEGLHQAEQAARQRQSEEQRQAKKAAAAAGPGGQPVWQQAGKQPGARSQQAGHTQQAPRAGPEEGTAAKPPQRTQQAQQEQKELARHVLHASELVPASSLLLPAWRELQRQAGAMRDAAASLEQQLQRFEAALLQAGVLPVPAEQLEHVAAEGGRQTRGRDQQQQQQEQPEDLEAASQPAQDLHSCSSGASGSAAQRGGLLDAAEEPAVAAALPDDAGMAVETAHACSEGAPSRVISSEDGGRDDGSWVDAGDDGSLSADPSNKSAISSAGLSLVADPSSEGVSASPSGSVSGSPASTIASSSDGGSGAGSSAGDEPDKDDVSSDKDSVEEVYSEAPPALHRFGPAGASTHVSSTRLGSTHVGSSHMASTHVASGPADAVGAGNEAGLAAVGMPSRHGSPGQSSRRGRRSSSGSSSDSGSGIHSSSNSSSSSSSGLSGASSPSHSDKEQSGDEDESEERAAGTKADWLDSVAAARRQLAAAGGRLAPPGKAGRRQPKSAQATAGAAAGVSGGSAVGLGSLQQMCAAAEAAALATDDSGIPRAACTRCGHAACPRYRPAKPGTDDAVALAALLRAQHTQQSVSADLAGDPPGLRFAAALSCCTCGCPGAAHETAKEATTREARQRRQEQQRQRRQRQPSVQGGPVTSARRLGLESDEDRQRRMAAAQQRRAEAEAAGDLLQESHLDALGQQRRTACSGCTACPGFCLVFRSIDANDPEVMFYCSLCGCRSEQHAIDGAWQAQEERRRAEEAEAAAQRRQSAGAAAAAAAVAAAAHHAEAEAYAVLGLPLGADAKTVARAYKKLALRLHPDKQAAGTAGSGGQAANDPFIRATEAYKLLTAGSK